MYNLNVNVTTATTAAVNNLLSVESAGTTPRTPEILNTLIAMTNPLDSYNFNDQNSNASLTNGTNCGIKRRTTSTSKSNGTRTTSTYPTSANNDSSNSSGSHIDSPTSPPSVQQTCSQLIKAGLKLSIQTKRKQSGDTSSSDLLDLDSPNNPKRRKLTASIKGEITGSEDEYDQNIISPAQGIYNSCMKSINGIDCLKLTPEDEERRRRRRERNKIAATKCRLKKREKTTNLINESETLETQNIELKTQIQQLKTQRQRLVDMLSTHTPSCVKQTNNNARPTNGTQQYHLDSPTNSNDNYTLSTNFGQHSDDCSAIVSTATTLPSIVTTLADSFIDNANLPFHTPRPPSVDLSLSYTHHLDHYSYPDPYSASQDVDTKPIIIINENGDNYTQITDLDSPNSPYQYSSSHCNYDSPPITSTQNYTNSGLDNGCMA